MNRNKNKNDLANEIANWTMKVVSVGVKVLSQVLLAKT